MVRTDVEASGEEQVDRREPVTFSNGEDLKCPSFSVLVEDLKWPPSMVEDRKLPPSGRGRVLEGCDGCLLLEEDEEEEDEEEEGLESPLRPSSSFSELNSSSCLCSCCSSNKEMFPLPLVAVVTWPCPFCANPRTRPAPWVLCPCFDQSIELRDFFEF